MLRSLFIVSLPRSLSSDVFQIARTALGLAEPSWTTAGEILNNDRYVHYGGPRNDAGLKYTTCEKDPDKFARMLEFLDHTVRPVEYAYKDVVQPFVTAAWLARRPAQPVLKIAPNLAHVAYSMVYRWHWHYPKDACSGASNVAEVVRGLIRAEAALAGVPGETVSFDDLMQDSASLSRALSRLYPDASILPLSYIDGPFIEERTKILGRRDDPKYKRLEELIEWVRCPLKHT